MPPFPSYALLTLCSQVNGMKQPIGIASSRRESRARLILPHFSSITKLWAKGSFRKPYPGFEGVRHQIM